MAKQELEQKLDEKLNAELSGKEYNSWGIDGQVLSIVRSMVSPSVAQKLWAVKDGRSNVVSITYDRSTLAEITVKKVKGKKHYNFLATYNDWTIGKITTVMCYDSFEDGIAQQDAWELKQQSAEYQRKVELAKQAKKIMEALNLTSTYELFCIAESLKGYRYNDEFNKILSAK